MSQPTDAELGAMILAACERSQDALREVGLHWIGRPLDEGVREAVEELKQWRQLQIISAKLDFGEVKEIPIEEWDPDLMKPAKGVTTTG